MEENTSHLVRTQEGIYSVYKCAFCGQVFNPPHTIQACYCSKCGLQLVGIKEPK